MQFLSFNADGTATLEDLTLEEVRASVTRPPVVRCHYCHETGAESYDVQEPSNFGDVRVWRNLCERCAGNYDALPAADVLDPGNVRDANPDDEDWSDR